MKGVFKINTEQYTLIKIPIKEIIKQNYKLTIKPEDEIKNEYLIAQGYSLLFDQIERIRNYKSNHMKEIILVVAKKEQKEEKTDKLKKLLNSGFSYNGVHYSRFGKSASQGKDGITAFVCDNIFEELYMVTQMDIEIEECVISKYESQRCLPFSSCTIIPDYIPNIVIIGEYEKTLSNRLIKYVVERKKEFVNKETGKTGTYNSREIEEGYRDIKLSPFDGCGCHEKEFMEKVKSSLELDYSPIGSQIRMPFIKGYSVYVPFKQILKEWGYEYLTDILGKQHLIDDIDCIWNISMFKGYKIFKKKYGVDAWDKYIETVKKYDFKLGISKYSHHVKNLNRKTRTNFQYLQCLNLWNPKYVSYYESGRNNSYDILSKDNEGKIISVAKYTTNLFEKIIKGDKFYTYKFMGISDTEDYEPESKYLEAALVNDVMLKDPAVKQFIYRKLKKSIDAAKVGKIYVDGFYHTIVGDMIGYLEYAVGNTPIGCLNAGEFFCDTLKTGDCLSFRSPLVDPSEVNKVSIVKNDITEKWFSYFKDQDVVMLNMYDLSFPQQGGADADGDIVLLCNDPIIIKSKIDKPIIIDINDKAMAVPKKYTKENLTEYELMTRDSRIGEITNVATSIENKYVTDEKIKTLYSDYASLLRIFQGKEIDFLKTGLRWNMNSGLRKHLKQLPYFLLFNYPKKMKTYQKIKEKNKLIENSKERFKLNAFHSPSPMNELCDYICTWEKKNILWNNNIDDLVDTRCLIINNDLSLNDKSVIRVVRRYINDYATAIKEHVDMHREKSDDEDSKFNMEILANQFKSRLKADIGLSDEIIANYVIKVSYNSMSISKSLAWSAYGDYIIKNLNENSNPKRNISIVEVPYKTDISYEYLGKYYEFKEADTYL